MNDQDKPFITYRAGFGSLKIVPRNAQGWRETIIWCLLVVPIIVAFLWFATGEPDERALYSGLALFTVAMTGWGVGGMWWMRRRSEVVDIEELLALKREAERNRRR